MAEQETGWLSGIDPEMTGPHRWQPVLQTSWGCVAFELWFATEEECDAFIRDEVLGQRWHPREGKE